MIIKLLAWLKASPPPEKPRQKHPEESVLVDIVITTIDGNTYTITTPKRRYIGDFLGSPEYASVEDRVRRIFECGYVTLESEQGLKYISASSITSVDIVPKETSTDNEHTSCTVPECAGCAG